MTEAETQHAIRLALGCLPDFRIFRNNVGTAQLGKSHVRYGLAKGSSDLIGILAPTGRFVALEVKSDTGRLAHEQDLWLKLVRKLGGFACVVRSVPEALEAIDRARAGAYE